MRLWAFGAHNLGRFSKTLKSVLLKERLEDSSLVLCARPHHHTPQKQNLSFFSRLKTSNQEAHQNEAPPLSLTFSLKLLS